MGLRFICLGKIPILVGIFLVAMTPVNAQRLRTSLDVGWKFELGGKIPDPSNVALASDCTVPQCLPSTDDSKWRVLSVPHDFVVEGNFTSSGDKSHGYLPYGTGWYRLHITIPTNFKGKAIWIDFDGTQRASQVYLNGKKIGDHASGYTSYRFFIGTGSQFDQIINYGADNLLAVFIDCTKPDGWWYDGGGIYRHVWLNSANPLYVEPWGVYLPASVETDTITQLEEILIADATIKAQTSVVNLLSTAQSFTLESVGTDKSGKIVCKATTNVNLAAHSNNTFTQNLLLSSVQLWSLDTPALYTMTTTLSANSEIMDTVRTSFGVRSIRWDKEKGFFLNEQPVKIKGMANHQDFAGVGVAIPDKLQAFRVSRLKEMGCNAWRTAHNPPNPELLDETDKQGMLVWDENHRNNVGSPWEDDMRSLILRDRNHPSVVMWSLCNEKLCSSWNAANAKVLKAIAEKLDPDGGRPITAAMNGGYTSDFTQVLDVMGINYHPSEYDTFHKQHSNQPMIGSETSSDYSDRSIYANDKTRAYVSAYDVNHPSWGGTAENSWCPIVERSFVSGGFVWTGFDYKGEPTPYGWPNINSHFGNIDIAGFPKDNFYYYQSVWLDQPILHVFPHWNWNSTNCSGMCSLDENGAPSVDVWIYTNADEAELFLNGNSLGKKPMPKESGGHACRHVDWKVSYTSGTIEGKGYINGKIHATDSATTTGAPTNIQLEVEYPTQKTLAADGVDVALVKVSIIDNAGRMVPTDNRKITFSLTGPGSIIGLGNGDPSSHEHDKPQSPMHGSRSVFNGLGRVILQSSTTAGQLKLTATSHGLKPGSVTINSK